MRILKAPFSWMGEVALNLAVLAAYQTMSRLPFGARYRLAMAAATAIYRLWGNGRRRLKYNLCLVSPALAGAKLDAAARDVVCTIVRDWAALFRPEKEDVIEISRRMQFEGMEKLLAHVSARAGRCFADRLVLTAIHMGSFGAALDAFSLFQVPTYAPAERIRPAALSRLLVRLRSKGFLLLEEIERGTTFRKMVQRMDCGWAVGVMVDIMARRDRGVRCRVGQGAGWFETGAVRLALERRARIIPIFVLWTGEKYRIIVDEEFRPVPTGNLEQDIDENTREFIEERIAPWIERHPGQWMQALWARLEPVGTEDTRPRGPSKAGVPRSI
jgi:lauroyl/myristoyl acyltransferase